MHEEKQLFLEPEKIATFIIVWGGSGQGGRVYLVLIGVVGVRTPSAKASAPEGEEEPEAFWSPLTRGGPGSSETAHFTDAAAVADMLNLLDWTSTSKDFDEERSRFF